MDFKDLVTLYFERSNALQTYWGFYVTIVLGLLAFFGSLKASSQKRFLAIVISIAFVMFASVNLLALEDVSRARIVARDLISKIDDPDPAKHDEIAQIKGTITPPEQWQVAMFHFAGDLMFLGGIWVLALRKGSVE